MKFKEFLESVKLVLKFISVLPFILFVALLILVFGDPTEEDCNED